MKKMFSLLLFLALLAGGTGSYAQQTVNTTYHWTGPTTGSTAVRYAFETSMNGGPYLLVTDVIPATADPIQFTVPLEVFETYTVRVRAADEKDRWGPNSLPSEAYTPDLGPPGVPTPPIRIP